MTKDEALKMAIEAMIYHIEQTRSITSTCIAINACKEALAQPVVKDSLTVQKPLSDADLLDVFEECYGHDDMDYTQKYFARAIEAKHGIY